MSRLGLTRPANAAILRQLSPTASLADSRELVSLLLEALTQIPEMADTAGDTGDYLEAVQAWLQGTASIGDRARAAR